MSSGGGANSGTSVSPPSYPVFPISIVAGGGNNNVLTTENKPKLLPLDGKAEPLR